MPIIIAALAALVLMLSNSAPVAAAKQKQVCRDAKTGTYVSHAYAKKYPGLTVCEAKK